MNVNPLSITRATYYTHGRPPYPEDIFRIISTFIKTTDKVIDVGCGNGRGIIPLYNRCTKHVVGVDPDQDMLNELSRQEKDIPYRQGWASDLPALFPEERFQAVVAFSALTLFDDEPSLRSIHHILEPDGLFLDVGDEGTQNDPIGAIMREVLHEAQVATQFKPRIAPQDKKNVELCGFRCIKNIEVSQDVVYDFSRTWANIKSRLNYPTMTSEEDEKVKRCLEQRFQHNPQVSVAVKYRVTVYKK